MTHPASRTTRNDSLSLSTSNTPALYRQRIGYDLQQHAAYRRSWATALKEGGAKELMNGLSEVRMTADLIAPEPGGEVEL